MKPSSTNRCNTKSCSNVANDTYGTAFRVLISLKPYSFGEVDTG